MQHLTIAGQLDLKQQWLIDQLEAAGVAAQIAFCRLCGGRSTTTVGARGSPYVRCATPANCWWVFARVSAIASRG